MCALDQRLLLPSVSLAVLIYVFKNISTKPITQPMLVAYAQAYTLVYKTEAEVFAANIQALACFEAKAIRSGRAPNNLKGLPPDTEFCRLRAYRKEFKDRHIAALARARLFEAVANMPADALLSTKQKALASDAAKELGRVFVPPRVSTPLTSRGAVRASGIARARLADARNIANFAQFRLDKILQFRPQNVTHLHRDCEVHKGVVQATARRLRQLARDTRLGTMRHALATVLRLCTRSLEYEVTRRVEGMDAFFTRAREEAGRVAALSASVAQLEIAQSLKAASKGPIARSLVLDLLWDTCGPADSVHAFAAFPGAWDLPWVHELSDACYGIPREFDVTERVYPLDRLPTARAPAWAASLSKCSTLCVVEGPALQEHALLYNFILGRCTRLRVPGLAWACVCEGALFLGVRRATQILHAPLAAVFAGLQLSLFGSFDVPGEIWSAATDRSDDGELVFHDKAASALVRVDLRARQAREVIACRNFDSIGGFSGIRVPGALCVARAAGRGGAAMVVLSDGHVVAAPQALSGTPTLLPSAAVPTETRRAAFVDCDACIAQHGKWRWKWRSIRPGWQTLARVYRNVFLCIDKTTHQWYAACITVP
eukprot:gnl/Chilomastix_cuspidata/6108.p1 GENE.gnl/Chilomastix_cuspidata/6108~~gnl/Chilomastix_cuspidata/6108.p1  ORF type:complete len:620 (+),score=148.39 gnl/Chilomastix_cuspidata/6108:55-1860(+)